MRVNILFVFVLVNPQQISVLFQQRFDQVNACRQITAIRITIFYDD